MKKKNSKSDLETLIVKLITKDFDGEIVIYKQDGEILFFAKEGFRMEMFTESIIDKSNPNKPVKYDENYISRTTTSDVVEIKDGSVYFNDQLIGEHEELRYFGDKLNHKDDIN